MQGVSFFDGEKLRSIFNKLCFATNIVPAPRVRDTFKARRSQNTLVDPPIIVKLETKEKVALLRALGAYRRANNQQRSIHLLGFDSPAVLYVNE